MDDHGSRRLGLSDWGKDKGSCALRGAMGHATRRPSPEPLNHEPKLEGVTNVADNIHRRESGLLFRTGGDLLIRLRVRYLLANDTVAPES